MTEQATNKLREAMAAMAANNTNLQNMLQTNWQTPLGRAPTWLLAEANETNTTAAAAAEEAIQQLQQPQQSSSMAAGSGRLTPQPPTGPPPPSAYTSWDDGWKSGWDDGWESSSHGWDQEGDGWESSRQDGWDDDWKSRSWGSQDDDWKSEMHGEKQPQDDGWKSEEQPWDKAEQATSADGKASGSDGWRGEKRRRPAEAYHERPKLGRYARFQKARANCLNWAKANLKNSDLFYKSWLHVNDRVENEDFEEVWPPPVQPIFKD